MVAVTKRSTSSLKIKKKEITWTVKAKVVIGAFRAVTRSAPIAGRFQEQHRGSQSKKTAVLGTAEIEASGVQAFGRGPEHAS